jgi:hypothetical protein
MGHGPYSRSLGSRSADRADIESMTEEGRVCKENHYRKRVLGEIPCACPYKWRKLLSPYKTRTCR